jgi:hypothetical protein
LATETKEKSSGKKPASRGWRIAKGVLACVVVAGLGSGAVWGYAALHENVRTSPQYRMTSQSLVLERFPPWMTEAIRSELDVRRLDPTFPKEFSLLDDDVCDRMAEAYGRCLWVERVERIVRRDPRSNTWADPNRPSLEIDLKFRRPLAFVQVQEGFCLVDEQGVRLPGLYHEPRLGNSTFLAVTGVPWLAPQPGQAWADPALAAALKVASAVESKRQTFHLVSVDMSNFGYKRSPRDTEIALWTANETRIKWGKAPSPEAERLQEKTAVEKVAYLEFVYKSLHGQVDGVLSYIDIPNEAIKRRSTDVATRVRS